LLLHWGGRAERAFYPTGQQLRQARAFIAAGADLIIGHHSHTLQPYEIIQGKHVFYSLGNFCFSDVLSDGRWYTRDWTREADSAILIITFRADGYAVEMVPIRNGRHCIVRDDSAWPRYWRRCRYFRILSRSDLLLDAYFYKHRYLDPVVHFVRDDPRPVREKLRKVRWRNVRNLLRR
jgi:hypothetical protein